MSGEDEDNKYTHNNHVYQQPTERFIKLIFNIFMLKFYININ